MIATGTASGHNDLLIKLHDFLVDDVGWTELDFVGTLSPTDTSDINFVLRAPGGSSGNEFFFYAQSMDDVGNGLYSWKINGSIDWDADLLIGGQEMISPNVYVNLWQNDIDYWFYGSSRRVIVIAKVNTSYVSMYAGCFLPFALPSQYTKPFMIAANGNSFVSYDAALTINRMIADPGDQTAFYLNRSFNEWIAIQNHASPGSAEVNFYQAPASLMWPHRSIRNSPTDVSGTPQSWSYSGLSVMRPPTTGEMPQFLCHILSISERKYVGALDGVYSIPGFNMTSEQLISYGSPASNFRAFQNVFRTTPRDFMAIEEV